MIHKMAPCLSWCTIMVCTMHMTDRISPLQWTVIHKKAPYRDILLIWGTVDRAHSLLSTVMIPKKDSQSSYGSFLCWVGVAEGVKLTVHKNDLSFLCRVGRAVHTRNRQWIPEHEKKNMDYTNHLCVCVVRALVLERLTFWKVEGTKCNSSGRKVCLLSGH